MALSVPVTALTVAVLAPVYVRLALAVIALRRAHRVAVGDGGVPALEAAIRTHGNFAEYVPFALVLVLAAELNGAPAWAAGVPAAMLVFGRLLHASAVPAGNLPRRVQGMKLTFAALAVGALLNLAMLGVGLFAG